jgi:folate-binding protein YgfZ
MSNLNLSPYQAAHQSAAYYLVPESGILHIAGESRLDFLQRQTSNDVRDLRPGKTVLTVLTSPIGRILDVLCLLQQGEMIEALTLAGYAAKTTQFLRSRIFFMDRVTVEDASLSLAQIDLLGPEAGQVLKRLGIPSIPQAGELAAGSLGQAELRLIRLEQYFGLGVRVLVAAQAASTLQKALDETGAVALDAETYHILRVEAGLPGAGFELVQDYTPLETGLQAAVSTSKGCYTGQEVLARQINFDKVTQHLAGLRLTAPAQTGERVWAEGKVIGAITTFAQSPRLGAIALAVVKRPYQEVGTRVVVGEGVDGASTAQVVSLPFS